MFRTFKHNFFSSTLKKGNSLMDFKGPHAHRRSKSNWFLRRKLPVLFSLNAGESARQCLGFPANSFKQFRVQASTAHELVDSGEESPRFNLILCSSSFCPWRTYEKSPRNGWGDGQWAGHLSFKCEDQSLNPQHLYKDWWSSLPAILFSGPS